MPCIEKSANYDTFLNMFRICFSNTLTSIGLETCPFIPASIAIFLSSSNILTIITNNLNLQTIRFYTIDIFKFQPYHNERDRTPVNENMVRSPLAALKMNGSKILFAHRKRLINVRLEKFWLCFIAGLFTLTKPRNPNALKLND